MVKDIHSNLVYIKIMNGKVLHNSILCLIPAGIAMHLKTVVSGIQLPLSTHNETECDCFPSMIKPTSHTLTTVEFSVVLV